MPEVGYITLRESKLLVGETFTRITGMAQGDSIKIMQPNADVSVIEGALGSATFVFGESILRSWELVLVPSSSDVTLLHGYRSALKPFKFQFFHGVTKLTGWMAMDKDSDLIVSNSGNPITLSGFMVLTNRLVGAQGLNLQ